MRAAALLAALLFVLPVAAHAAPPPRTPDGFALAVPPYTYAFPRDHASHPDYRTEWWYYTGHLTSGAKRFGYELTFFRVGLSRTRGASASVWAAHDVYFVHLALTDENGRRFDFDDAARRPALGIAGADTSRYRVWLEDSRAELAADGVTHHLRGVAPQFSFELDLEPLKAPAVHGIGGVSQKTAGAGNASHYYSLTRMRTRGTLRARGESLEVGGESWMDHEYGSGGLSAAHAGWDWFSVQLDDGRELMLYQLRLKDGTIEPLSSGSLIERDGTVRHLPREAFTIAPRGTWRSPRTNATYPSGWRLELPGEQLRLEVAPVLEDQELFARAMGGVVYWEGSCRVRGTSRGAAVSGVGYTELTGYTGRPPY